MKNTRTLAMIAALAWTLLGIACGSSKSSPATPASPTVATDGRAGSGHMGGMCPMQVAGTRVTAQDTQDGVAVVFTTSGDVAQLRERVHEMAAMHEHMMMRAVPSTARAEDIDGGARIVLVPKDAAQLTELRAHVHAHAEQMAAGHCPMMEHGA